MGDSVRGRETLWLAHLHAPAVNPATAGPHHQRSALAHEPHAERAAFQRKTRLGEEFPLGVA